MSIVGFSSDALKGQELIVYGDLSEEFVQKHILENPELSSADVHAARCTCTQFATLIPPYMLTPTQLHEKVITWMAQALYQDAYAQLAIEFPHQPEVKIVITMIPRDDANLSLPLQVQALNCEKRFQKCRLGSSAQMYTEQNENTVLSLRGLSRPIDVTTYLKAIHIHILRYRGKAGRQWAKVGAFAGMCTGIGYSVPLATALVNAGMGLVPVAVAEVGFFVPLMWMGAQATESLARRIAAAQPAEAFGVPDKVLDWFNGL